MRVAGKQFRAALEKVDRSRLHEPDEAVGTVKSAAFAKFDETVEVAVRLGVDPRHADQIVRGMVVLPHGTGRTVVVAVIAQGDKAKEAEAAGADFVGPELVDKIKGGWLGMDVLIATPDMMSKVGPLGRILGPRGLMPNPKSGTVTTDVERAVKDVKAGRIEFRVDRTGNLHAPIGKLSFDDARLGENLKSFMDAVVRGRPAVTKGTYIKSVTLSSTMGPGVRIDPGEYR